MWKRLTPSHTFLELCLFQSLMSLKAFSFPKEWPRPLKAVAHCASVSGGTTRQSCWCSLKITSRTAGLWTKPMKPKTARQPEHSLPSCDRRVVLPPSPARLNSFSAVAIQTASFLELSRVGERIGPKANPADVFLTMLYAERSMS